MMESTTLNSGLALLFGAMHALEPGHGKTALLTYMASGKKSWREGILISLISSITHSLAVFLLAFVSHTFIHHQGNPPESLRHGLQLISGFLICGFGIWILVGAKKKHCCHHHDSTPLFSKRGLFSSGLLGVATGMIPCPTIVVAYLSGLSSGNTYYGIMSVVIFAVGMFFSLATVVTLFAFGGEKIMQSLSGKALKWNWSLIQGWLFVMIGLITAIYH